MNWKSQEFYCDGGCRGNHKFGPREAYGSISDGETVERLTWYDARTNNEAEFATLHFLLSFLAPHYDPQRPPTIYMDSALVVNSLTKGWNVKAANLRGLFEDCETLLKGTKAKLKWVPREQIETKVGH